MATTSLPRLSSHTVDADARCRWVRRRPERYPYPVPGHLLPFQVATRCARTVKVMMGKVKILSGDPFSSHLHDISSVIFYTCCSTYFEISEGYHA